MNHVLRIVIGFVATFVVLMIFGVGYLIVTKFRLAVVTILILGFFYVVGYGIDKARSYDRTGSLFPDENTVGDITR